MIRLEEVWGMVMNLRNEILARYAESLLDSKRAFSDTDLPRHLDAALSALSEVRPQCKITLLNLVADRSIYPCPDDLLKVNKCLYGLNVKNSQNPWDDWYVGCLPHWHVFKNNNNQRVLFANPAPTTLQLTIIGPECEIIYCAGHVLADDECSLNKDEIGLLILRAQAEAMREISMKNTTQSYQLREGISSTPQNGTPAYLYKTLMEEFNVRVSR